MKNIFHITVFVFASLLANAQVGVGTDSPDPNTVLHLVSTSGNKGLIIPKLSTGDMRNMASAGPQTGTLVFNTDSNEIYSFDATDNKWYSLTPLKKQLYPGSGVRKNIDNDKDGLVDRLDVRTGYGITPIGGVIMWSGSIASIPDGWKLCDGNNGTPNLSGKFVVGSGGSGGYGVSDSGGENSVTLSVNTIPPHSHNGYTNTDGDHGHSGNMAFVADNDDNDHSHWAISNEAAGYHGHAAANLRAGGANHRHFFTTNVGGGLGQAHENRPPYYSLAYIMRVK